jgi:hypothetical protein
VSLPAADDLFRPTAPAAAEDEHRAEHPSEQEPEQPAGRPARAPKKPSGRVRHDEKMTVYVTSDELLDLEHARLMLRRNHGMAVDRGRLVREAISLVLADFEANGDDSVLVRRLTDG